MRPPKRTKKDSSLRAIPSVRALLDHPAAAALAAAHGREALIGGVRETLAALRAELREGGAPRNGELEPARILDRTSERLSDAARPRLMRVINATGIILHTGLGRAVLAPAALRAVAEEQRGYSLLEVDRASGDRGLREVHVAALLRRLTGAEAATVVNNNAGATLLALTALAAGREVVVSRSQLIEIGGSFRLPEIMEASGARLVEVGTTNKTYARDYEKAIGPATALLMRVHTSNYRIVGFTEAVGIDDLVALGRRHRLPVLDDLGSGALVDLSPWGISDEPTAPESVRAGADVIVFSGDKLLGGPQAGILVGKQEPLARIRKHPLFRALRVDKLTLTALEATLKLFLDRERLPQAHPTLRMIAADRAALEGQAKLLAERLGRLTHLDVATVADASEVGGGSVPALSLPTVAVSVRHRGLSPDALAARLRENDPPVFARIKKDRLLFDPRTLQEGEANEVVEALARIRGAVEG